jgi:hypothetical protein
VLDNPVVPSSGKLSLELVTSLPSQEELSIAGNQPPHKGKAIGVDTQAYSRWLMAVCPHDSIRAENPILLYTNRPLQPLGGGANAGMDRSVNHIRYDFGMEVIKAGADYILALVKQSSFGFANAADIQRGDMLP